MSKAKLSRRERNRAVGGRDLLSAALAHKDPGERAAILAVANAQKLAVAGMPLDPVKRAMRTNRLPLFSLFAAPARRELPPRAAQVKEDVLRIVRHYASARRLYDETGAIHRGLLRNCRQVGFFGFSIPETYGGAGATFEECLELMVEIGKISPALPPYFSVTAIIGIVGALLQCGTEQQKRKWLPLIAQGKALSCFAATENGKGCDITNAEARGVIEVEDGVVKITATKLFITLAGYTADEVAFQPEDFVPGLEYSDDAKAGKAEGEIITFTAEFFKLRTGETNAEGEEILRDVVAIIELPRHNGPTFALNDSYTLMALHPRVPNKGIWMRDHAIPVDNLLAGDGLTTIFRDLNAGRFFVATGAGMLMRHLLSSAATWVPERKGMKNRPLESFQKLRFSVATMAARIVGTDALSNLAASLEDRHIANEVMAMIAKVAGTNWARDAATKLGVEQHGGRTLIAGHPINQLLWEIIVACVYEGPNSVLDMAALAQVIAVIQELGLTELFAGLDRADVDMFALLPKLGKSASKLDRARQVGAALGQIASTLWSKKGGIWDNRQSIFPSAYSLTEFWVLCQGKVELDLEGKTLADYFTRSAGAQAGFVDKQVVARFAAHIDAALAGFGAWRKELFAMMLKYLNKLPDEQVLLQYAGYQPLETTVALFAAVTSAAQAARDGDMVTVDALDLQCELLRCQLEHKDPTSRRLLAAMERVYEHVREGRFHQLYGTTIYPVLQPVVDRTTFDAMMDAAAAGEKFAYPVAQEPVPYHEWLEQRGWQRHYRPLPPASTDADVGRKAPIALL